MNFPLRSKSINKQHKAKIALCFSGQPRFIEDGFPYILKNLIQNNEILVFAHLWHGSDITNKAYKFGGNGTWQNQRIRVNAVEQFRNLYNPVELLVEEPRNFKNSSIDFAESINRYYPGSISNPLEPDFRNRTINNMLSAFYSMSEVSKLKKKYEHSNDLIFDWVVRCRTDSQIQTKIKFEKFNPNFINYSGNQNQPDGMVNDWLNFGSSKNMDVFMNQYATFEFLIEKTMSVNGGAASPEMIHRVNLDLHGISAQSHNIKISLPRF